jgi:hypothetical protein
MLEVMTYRPAIWIRAYLRRFSRAQGAAMFLLASLLLAAWWNGTSAATVLSVWWPAVVVLIFASALLILASTLQPLPQQPRGSGLVLRLLAAGLLGSLGVWALLVTAVAAQNLYRAPTSLVEWLVLWGQEHDRVLDEDLLLSFLLAVAALPLTCLAAWVARLYGAVRFWHVAREYAWALLLISLALLPAAARAFWVPNFLCGVLLPLLVVDAREFHRRHQVGKAGGG